MNTQDSTTLIMNNFTSGIINHAQAIDSLNALIVLGMPLSSAIDVSNALQAISEGRIKGNVEMYHRMVNSGTAPIVNSKGASL